MENEPTKPTTESNAGAAPDQGTENAAEPGGVQSGEGLPRKPDTVTVRDGQIIIINGLTYQVVDLDPEWIQLRRVTCEFLSDGRVSSFVYGGDQKFP